MISIIIPYRDRENHLAVLAPRLREALPDAEVLVIEQGDDKPFNRAKLLNVGAHYTKGNWLVMHDVDKVPVKVDYFAKAYDKVIQLEWSGRQRMDYLGGVTVFDTWLFKHIIDGYSNSFWGWGGEDNEMMFRLKSLRINVAYQIGQFESLPHPRPAQEFDPRKWEQAQRPRNFLDGYASCEHKVAGVERHDFYTKITVNL